MVSVYNVKGRICPKQFTTTVIPVETDNSSTDRQPLAVLNSNFMTMCLAIEMKAFVQLLTDIFGGFIIISRRGISERFISKTNVCWKGAVL